MTDPIVNNWLDNFISSLTKKDTPIQSETQPITWLDNFIGSLKNNVNIPSSNNFIDKLNKVDLLTKDTVVETKIWWQIKSNATDRLTKFNDWIAKVKAKVVDPVKLKEIDDSTKSIQNLLTNSNQSAYTSGISEERKKIQTIANNYLNNLILWEGGVLSKAEQTSDPEVIKYYSDIATKIKKSVDDKLAATDDATLKTNYHTILDDIYTNIDNQTRRGSDLIEEQIATDVDQSKYNKLNRFQKLKYGISLGIQQTNEAVAESADRQQRNLWEFNNPVAGVVADVPIGIVWGIKKAVNQWIINPSVYLWNLVWWIMNIWTDIGRRMGAWFRDTGDVLWMSPWRWNIYVAGMKAEQDKVDWWWMVGNLLKWLRWQIASHPDDVVGSIWGMWISALAGWAVWAGAKAIPVVANIISSGGNARRNVQFWIKVVQWLVDNAIITAQMNTAAGIDRNNQWMLLDMWLAFIPSVLGATSVLKWEYKNLLEFSKQEKIFNWLYNEAIKTTDTPLDALKSIKNDYSLIGKTEDLDSFIAKAEANGGDFAYQDLKNIAETKYLKEIWLDAGKWAIMAAYHNTVAPILKVETEQWLEAAKHAASSAVGILLDEKMNLVKWQEKLLESLTALWDTASPEFKQAMAIIANVKPEYISLSSKMPDILNRIATATNGEDIGKIFWNDMGGKAVGEFFASKYKMNEYVSTIGGIIEGLKSTDKVVKDNSVLQLQTLFQRFGVNDIDTLSFAKDVTSQRWRSLANQIVMNNVSKDLTARLEKILPGITDGMVKKNIQSVIDESKKILQETDDELKLASKTSKEVEVAAVEIPETIAATEKLMTQPKVTMGEFTKIAKSYYAKRYSPEEAKRVEVILDGFMNVWEAGDKNAANKFLYTFAEDIRKNWEVLWFNSPDGFMGLSKKILKEMGIDVSKVETTTIGADDLLKIELIAPRDVQWTMSQIRKIAKEYWEEWVDYKIVLNWWEWWRYFWDIVPIEKSLKISPEKINPENILNTIYHEMWAHEIQKFVKPEVYTELLTHLKSQWFEWVSATEKMANDITDALIGVGDFKESINLTAYHNTIKKISEFIKKTINTVSEMIWLKYRTMPGLTPDRYWIIIDGIQNDLVNGFIMWRLDSMDFLWKTQRFANKTAKVDIYSLFEKMIWQVNDEFYKDNSVFWTVKRLVMQWYNSFYWPDIKDISRNLKDLLVPLKSLDELVLFKDGKLITSLDEKLKVLVGNNFSIDKLPKWYTMPDTSGVKNILDGIISNVVDFDPIQRRIFKKMTAITFQWTPDEHAVLDWLFWTIDAIRWKYAELLIDSIFTTGKITSEDIYKLNKLGMLTWDIESKLWVPQWALTVVRRYMDKATVFGWMAKALEEFKKSGSSEIQNIAKEFFAMYNPRFSKTWWSFVDNMQIIYDDIFNDLKSIYFDDFIAKQITPVTDITELQSIMRKFFWKDLKMLDAIEAWDMWLMKARAVELTDDMLKDTADRFLYNPFEYFYNKERKVFQTPSGKISNPQQILDALLSQQAGDNKLFWDFYRSLIINEPSTPHIFGEYNDLLKVRIDEYINKSIADIIKWKWWVEIFNPDLLKARLKNMSAIGITQSDSPLFAAAQDAMTEAQFAQQQWQKIMDISSDIFKWAVDSSVISKQTDMDTFDTMLHTIYDKGLFKKDSSFLENLHPSLTKLGDNAEWLAIRDAVWNLYETTAKQAQATVMRITDEFGLEVVDSFDTLMTKVFNSPLDAKKMRWQMTLKYLKWLGTKLWELTPVVYGGEHIPQPFRFFYPVMRAMYSTEDGKITYLKLANLNSTGKSIKMDFDLDIAKFLQSAGIGNIENGKFIVAWEDAIKIGDKLSAGKLSTLYKQVMWKTNYKRYKYWAFNNISDEEMSIISQWVSNLFQEAKTSKALALEFDIKNKDKFLSSFMYSFWDNYYRNMKTSIAMKEAHGFRGNVWKRQDVVETEIKSPFINTLTSPEKKNVLRYWLDSYAPNLSNDLAKKVYEVLEWVGYKTPKARDAILYKWYIDHNLFMNTVQELRSFMYNVLFNVWQVPKLVQQWVTQAIKADGVINKLYPEFRDFANAPLSAFTNRIWFKIDNAAFFSDAKDIAENGVSNKIGTAWNLVSNRIFNGMGIVDDAFKPWIKELSVRGAMQNLWYDAKYMTELGEMYNELWKKFRWLTDEWLNVLFPDEFIGGKQLIDPIIAKYNWGYFIGKTDLDNLEWFIQRNVQKLNDEWLLWRLQSINNDLHWEYKNFAKTKQWITAMTQWYMSSFFQAGMKSEDLVSVAGATPIMQFILPLFNRATKEMSTAFGDMAMDFTRMIWKYDGIGGMLKNPKFYAEMISSPSVIHLASQLSEYSLRYNRINKLFKAQWDSDNELDYVATMNVLVGPMAAAMQFLSPEVKAIKMWKFMVTEWDATAIQTATAMANTLITEYGKWFFKEGWMIADWIGETSATYVQAGKVGLDAELWTILFQTFMKRATASIVKWTMNVYRWYALDPKWYDMWQALNMILYWNLTKWAVEQAKLQERWFNINNLETIKSNLLFAPTQAATNLPNIGILQNLFETQATQKWLDPLIDGNWDYQKALTDMFALSETNGWKYKVGSFAKTVIDTLKWEWKKENMWLKQMSDLEIKKDEKAFIDQIYADPKLSLLDPNKLVARVMTYRGRFSASYALWVFLDDLTTKVGTDSTKWDVAALKAKYKALFGTTKAYTISTEKAGMADQKSIIMDQFVAQNYEAALKYNKQVGMNTYFLAADANGQTMNWWAYQSAITLDTFEKSLKSQWNYLPAMQSVKNYWSMFSDTYKDTIAKTISTNPAAFLNWMKSVTDFVDKSDKSDIDKVYVKWWILRWLGDRIGEISDKADSLWLSFTEDFRKAAGVVAWDMLDNSSRLTQAAALKQWLADYGIGTWGTGWKKPTIKKIADSTIKQANNLLKTITPEITFRSLPTANAVWWIEKWPTTPMTDYNLERVELKPATSLWAKSEGLTTPAPKLPAGKVITSRIKWLKKYWGYKQYQKAIKW